MSRKTKMLSIAEGRTLANQYPLDTAGRFCGDKAPGPVHYVCTRLEGHDGPHVAHVPGGEAAATWAPKPAKKGGAQ